VIPLARKGLPKSIIKKYGISKKAWAVYRGSRKGSHKYTIMKVRKLARRRNYSRKRRRRGSRTIPILPIAGVAAGTIEPIRRAMSGDFEGAIKELVQTTTGVSTEDGTFHPEWLGKFWYPVIAGIVGHKVAGWTGLNRVFSRLPSPLNKLRL